MKKLVLVIASLLLFQSMAMAGTVSALKDIVDDYRFSVTVEWDQKDEAALEKINANFTRELSALQASQKITAEDLQKVFAQAKAQDPELAKVLNLQDETAMAAEIQRLINVRSKEMYATGASWSPGAVFGWGLGILFILEIIVLAMKDSDCPNPGSYAEGVHYDCIWGDETQI